MNIFEPLGMKDSGSDSYAAIIPRRASGYSHPRDPNNRLRELRDSPTDLAGVTSIECSGLDTRRFQRPLFRVPSEERMFAVWLLRTAFADSGPSLQSQLDANAKLLERALALGAKRYPPYGGIASPADWQHHYGGPLYRRFAAAKQRYDPKRVLTPGPNIFALGSRVSAS